VSLEASFALQLAATTVGALLDYLVGRLTGAPALGIACWAGLTLLIATILEFSKDLLRDRNRNGAGQSSSYTRSSSLLNFVRPVSGYKWATVTRALWAAAFAGVAIYALGLAVITFRFLTMYHGLRLGQNSPLDSTVVTFVSNFQASAATGALVGGAFLLALLLKSEVLLPCGVALVSIANALLAGLPRMTPAAGFRSQVAYSLSAPDGWLFKLPEADVLWGCGAWVIVGVIACGIISGSVRV
jgi:hypothetical protein